MTPSLEAMIPLETERNAVSKKVMSCRAGERIMCC
jgi:hypothetical protein